MCSALVSMNALLSPLPMSKRTCWSTMFTQVDMLLGDRPLPSGRIAPMFKGDSCMAHQVCSG